MVNIRGIMRYTPPCKFIWTRDMFGVSFIDCRVTGKNCPFVIQKEDPTNPPSVSDWDLAFMICRIYAAS